MTHARIETSSRHAASPPGLGSATRRWGAWRTRLHSAAAAGLLIAASGLLAPAAAWSATFGTPTTDPGSGLARATFAGGCFWCMEPPFDKLDGVVSTTSGYIGGTVRNPDYRGVSAGVTGHTEAVEIVYDPKRVTFAKLLEVYWVNVDPTVSDRQFCDKGSQYRPEIFYHDAQQKSQAEASKAALVANKPFKAPVVVNITQAGEFWPAEDYHQDYYRKNPIRYKYYRTGCGRDARLKELWGARAGE